MSQTTANNTDALDIGAPALLGKLYAEALLAVAEKRSQVDIVGEELLGLSDELRGSSGEIVALISTPAIPRSQREPFLRKAMEGRVCDTFFDFVLLLNRNDRLPLFQYVARAYKELLDRRYKRLTVVVTSVVPLSAEQLETVKALAGRTGMNPQIVNRLDPAIIGGLVIQVGDKVYDTSVRSRIETIRKQLLARGSNEIKVQRDPVGSHN